MKKKHAKSIDTYKVFISELLIDEDIKLEVLDQIETFERVGIVDLDGFDLYGKILGREENDYIEIKYNNNNFNCNYTKWNGRSKNTIIQTNLKNENIFINKREYVKIKHPEMAPSNSFDTEEIEKIYDKNLKLLYESELRSNMYFYSFDDKLIYPYTWGENGFSLDKTWYIKNGSIIKYKLEKEFLSEKSKLEEKYYFCEGRNSIDNTNYFIELDEELFKKFMAGKISIDELINVLNGDVPKKKIKK